MNGWEVSLPRFEGPLDLLLSLVKANRFEIADFPLVEITTQYLDYLRRADQVDLSLSADFAYMAATLIQLKSASLLPRDPELAAREPDAREELVRRLMEHEQARGAAEFLKQRLEVVGASWSRSAGDWMDACEPETGFTKSLPPGRIDLLEVVRLARQALENAQSRQSLEFSPEGVTVEEMIDFLCQEVPVSGVAQGDWLLAKQRGRDRQSMLFLAILELAKTRKIELTQDVPFEDWSVRMAQVCHNEERAIALR